MGRPPRQFNPTNAPVSLANAPVIIPSPAPMPDEEKIAASIENMTLYPQDAPALTDAIERARFEARQEGAPMTFALEDMDLATLPGTTAGEEMGKYSNAEESATRLAASLEQIEAEKAHTEQVRRAYEQGRARAAAESGVPVEGLFDNALTRKRVMNERKYMVMVSPLPSDPLGARSVAGSINCVEYEVSLGVPVTLPYSIMAAMVEQGRCVPPADCPELVVQAIHAAASQGRHIVTPALADQRGQQGRYLGESAQGANAQALDQQFAASVYAQLGQRGALATPPPSHSQSLRF